MPAAVPSRMDTSSMILSYPHPRCCPTRDEVIASKIKIEEINEEISRLTKRIQDLHLERENHVSYISPLRRLPLDVLMEIICTCIDTGIRRDILGRICGTLRDAFIEMPTLWNKIRIWDRSRGYNAFVRNFAFETYNRANLFPREACTARRLSTWTSY
jgi:hypothetical protein